MSAQKISTFRERLSDAVNACSKSQSAIAFDLGIAKQTLSAWLTGQNSPRTPMVNVLADYFGVSPAWLLGFDVPRHEDKQKTKAWSEFIENRQSASEEPPDDVPKNDDIRLLIRGLNKLTPAQVEQATNVFRAMFQATNPDLFKGDDDK